MKGKLLALVGASLLLGCGPSATSVVGTYKGQAEAAKGSGTLAESFARGIGSTMNLEVRPDGTFHMIAMIVPIDGKWTLAGDTLTLTPDKVMGFEKSDTPMSSNKVMTFRVNGNTLEPTSGAPGGNFRFVKEGGKSEAGP